MPDDAVEIRCYAELNDGLPPERRYRTFCVPLAGARSVGALVERLGLSPDEVDLALVNGESVALEHRPRPGDRLALYPMFEALDISPLARLPARPLRRPRFVVDVHLGRLARLLRMLGFDTLWRQQWSDRELAEVAADEGRILLTRDRRLPDEWGVARAFLPAHGRPREQLAEVCERLQLWALARPFTRCMMCNAPLEPVDKAAVRDRLPERTRREHERFFHCTGCGRVYWEGSHHRHMQELIDRLDPRRADDRRPGA